jgi:phosphatidylserine/phosphatidylglycerophosphate/cardiolipin synthase-like enzyme
MLALVDRGRGFALVLFLSLLPLGFAYFRSRGRVGFKTSDSATLTRLTGKTVMFYSRWAQGECQNLVAHSLYTKGTMNTFKRGHRAAVTVALALSFCHANAAHRYPTDSPGGVAARVEATGNIEVAFSPDEGAEGLVVKVIDSARNSIRMLAYNFTSRPVVEALIRARRRGVDVILVADEKANTSEDRSGKARAALSALAEAGGNVRLIGVYAIAHDKQITVDASTVETGSFNFSAAAAHQNSENVMVNWNNPPLAEVYLKHFDRNYHQAVQYQARY